MRYSKNPEDIGTKLGPKLVQLISQTIAATKLKLLDTEHRARVASMQEIIDRAGREVADLYRPVIQSVTKDLDVPTEIADFIEKSVSGSHQWHAIAGLALSGSGLSSALSEIMTNTLQPSVSDIISRQPNVPAPINSVAQAIASGIISTDEGHTLGARQGFNSFAVDLMSALGEAYPDFSSALDMYRRGTITDNELDSIFIRNAIPAFYHSALKQLAHTPLSPADLADMVVRGIISESEGAKVAAQSGIDASDFSLLAQDTGEPLALMQLLEAKRRGFIDEATLRHGILQSRIRDEWISVAEQLAYEPMSVADAVNAVVQDQMAASQGEAIAQQNGLEPGNFQILYNTAGEPLSRTEMEDLYNRGLVTQDQVNQALRESRVKNKYVDLAFQLHRKVPPLFTVQRALKAGTISHDQAVTTVMDSGYSKADAEWIVISGASQATNPQQTKAVSAIEALYIDNMISSSDAVTALKAQGLTQASADVAVSTAEFRREAKITTQVVSSIRTRYVGRKVTKNTASGLLDGIGLPTAQRDTLLSLWDIELAANTRTLTEAQVVKAVSKTLITAADGQARLIAMGYSDSDATLLLEGA